MFFFWKWIPVDLNYSHLPGTSLTVTTETFLPWRSKVLNYSSDYEIQPLGQFIQCTHFCRIRDGGGGGQGAPPPPPPIIFEGLDWPQQTIYHWKGNLSETPIRFRYWKIFWFRDFMSNFRKMPCNCSRMAVRKNFQTFKIWTYYI